MEIHTTFIATWIQYQVVRMSDYIDSYIMQKVLHRFRSFRDILLYTSSLGSKPA